MFLIHQLTVALLCCLTSLDAIRLADTDLSEIVDGKIVAATETDNSQAVAVMDTDNSQALVPFDYWTIEKAGDRCRAARRGRNVRRVFGLVVGAVIALPVALIASFGTNVLYLTWYLDGAKDTLLFVSTYAAGIAGAWTTLMAGRAGVSLASWTSDMLAYLFGQDGHKPVCCCAAELQEDGTKLCGTVGSSIGRRAECPVDLPNHEADQCESVEPALTFNAELTDGSCKCVDVADCASNKYDRGHAWCKVESSSGCKAYPFKLNPFKHWDYCRPAPAEVDNSGTTMIFNTFISQFTINREKGFFRADPRFVWRWGSWVDTSKNLVIAPITVDGAKMSACLPGVPEETLDGCAQLCIEEGAPIASEKGETDQIYVPCVAFAYNHYNRLCVRIPDGATGAEFKPFARNPELPGGNVDGWSNFKLIGEQ